MVMLPIGEEKARLMSGSAGFGSCCVGWWDFMSQLGRCCVLVGFEFLGFFLVFLFSLSSFLPFGFLLYTSFVLGLRPSVLLTYATLLIKKKNNVLGLICYRYFGLCILCWTYIYVG
jgi:hypothetical protein